MATVTITGRMTTRIVTRGNTTHTVNTALGVVAPAREHDHQGAALLAAHDHALTARRQVAPAPLQVPPPHHVAAETSSVPKRNNAALSPTAKREEAQQEMHPQVELPQGYPRPAKHLHLPPPPTPPPPPPQAPRGPSHWTVASGRVLVREHQVLEMGLLVLSKRPTQQAPGRALAQLHLQTKAPHRSRFPPQLPRRVDLGSSPEESRIKQTSQPSRLPSKNT